MLPSSFCACLITLVASVVSVSAIPNLTVKASTHSVRVDGLENLKVTTTVINTGDETLKLINDPRGVLSSFPENTFSITNAAGSRPLFNGAMVKFSPAYAASLDDPNAFTVLAPGAHIDVSHDLSAAYNFTPSGPGDYLIEPSNRFIYVGADSTPRNILATVEGTAEVKLSGNLAVSRLHNRRAHVDTCSPDRQLLLLAATGNAQAYANSSYSYLTSISSGTDRYTTWFGTYTDDRKSIVQNHFQLISSHLFTTFTYECTCDEPVTIAYVSHRIFGFIFLCGGFWEIPDTGTDSKAGALVHESSHFTANGNTEDYIYGQSGAAGLARSEPDKAVMNADNHEYFAENTPLLP